MSSETAPQTDTGRDLRESVERQMVCSCPTQITPPPVRKNHHQGCHVPGALDALTAWHEAKAAYRQLDEVRAYGDDEAALTLRYVDEAMDEARATLAALEREQHTEVQG